VFVENDFDNFNREAFPLGETIDRPAVVKVLFRRSHLFRLVSIRLNLFHFGAEADPVRWNRQAIGDNNVTGGLRRCRELADHHGFQPLVAIWPRFLDDRIADVCFMPTDSERGPHLAEDRKMGTQLIVEHLAAMYGIPSVRLSEFFQRHRAESAGTVNPRLHYSCGDELHPSPEGARVAAEALKLTIDDLDAGRVPSAREISRSAQSDAEAIAAAKALGRAKPNYARVHNREGAQTQFERAIHLQPDFTHAHFNLARILIKTGRINEAVAELKRTIQIDPDHVGALNMLGMALGRQQKFAEAQAHLERAVRLDPNHAEARSNLGAAYAGQGRLREAIAQFEAALRIDPDNPEARENLKRVKAALQE